MRDVWKRVLALGLAASLTACFSSNKNDGDDESPAPSVAIAAAPTAVVLGASTTLTWSSTDADRCSASGAWTGSRPTSGSEVVTPGAAGTQTYVLSCSGDGGSVEDRAVVTVAAAPTPAPVVSLRATPDSIPVGSSSTLSWSSTDATGCTASGAWSGSRTPSGSEVVAPAAAGTLTYVLTCSGAGGSAESRAVVTVTGTPSTPMVTLSASPESIGLGASSVLNWSSSDATGCSAGGAWTGDKPLSGSEPVTPTTAGTQTYTLTCTGTGGTAQSVAVVTVTAPPTVSLAVAPNSIELGASSILSWSSTDAANCVASGAWAGDRSVSGSESVTPTAAGDLTYVLTCSGPGGSGEASATLTVVAPPTGTLRGRVFNSNDGSALSGATVSSGSRSVATASDGSFVLEVVAGDRAIVAAAIEGFNTNYRIVQVLQDQEAMLPIQLLPIGASQIVVPAAGGEVTIPGSVASVNFPPGSIDSSDPVRVDITDIAPAVSEANMPGDFTTLAGSAEGQIESMGALSVVLTRENGEPVNLAGGQTATLHIPLSTRNAAPPSEVPLWYFDPTSGRWVQEGVATLQGSAPDLYYEGAVAHFTTWNADMLYQTVRLTGCVEDRGQPVGNVVVTARGTDYTGTSTAYTDADGRFTIPVRRNSNLTLAGQRGTLTTSTISYASGDMDETLGSCLQIEHESQPFTVRLTWGAAPTDLDSHLYLPEGGEVWYGNTGSLEAPPYANLDLDDTDSFGPEVITVLRPRVGTYRYFVHNYSGDPQPGITSSQARLELSVNGNLQVFSPPAGEDSDSEYWAAFDVTIAPNCSATVAAVTPIWTVGQPDRPVQEDSSLPFCAIE